VDPLQFQEADAEFPIYLSKLIHAEVQVLYPDLGFLHDIPLYTEHQVLPTGEFRIMDIHVNDEFNERLAQCSNQIRSNFTSMDVPVHIYRNELFSLEDLLIKTRFSDLLIAGLEFTNKRNQASQMSEVMDTLLHKSECPVMLLPEKFQTIQEVVLAYDGTASSVYAIRQFAALFDSMLPLPVTVVHVRRDERKVSIPYKEDLQDWIIEHFRPVKFRILEGNAEEELMMEWMYLKNAVITFGAFGRKPLLSFFSNSHAEKVINTVNAPVFITHT
jgi:nucleotide-binding universal stress UspA family protein